VELQHAVQESGRIEVIRRFPFHHDWSIYNLFSIHPIHQSELRFVFNEVSGRVRNVVA
jgi:hypothetical protein